MVDKLLELQINMVIDTLIPVATTSYKVIVDNIFISEIISERTALFSFT